MAQLTLTRLSKIVTGLDLIAISLGILVSALFRFGDLVLLAEVSAAQFLNLNLEPHLQVAMIFVIWTIAHLGTRPGDIRILGVGLEEYRRVALSGLYVPMILAIGALLVKLDVSRAFVGSSIILGTALMFFNHWAWRTWLGRVRSRGILTTRIALIASNSRLEKLSETFGKTSDGFQIGLVVVDNLSSIPESIRDLGVPVITASDDLVGHLAEQGCQLAFVSGTARVTDNFIKRFSWQLEGSGIHLAVSSDLDGISRSRLDAIELGGSATYLVKVAAFEGWKFLLKRSLDITLAFVASVLTLPIVLIAGFMIWREDRGPMFFAQDRVGIDGSTFKMFKLRSMKVGAELEHSKLADTNTSPNAVMFKNDHDPRVTRVGHFIRRWSIDELPQFWNVVLGNMSLVGPRPPLPSEVSKYETDAFRRLLVKPGITGLWQVSGRNKLSWEETVQLDLHYVENWSLVQDLLIMVKTIREVFLPKRIA